jgi:Homoserine kinase
MSEQPKPTYERIEGVEVGQYVSYRFFKVDPAWRRLPIEERVAHKEAFADVVGEWATRMEGLRAYNVSGIRPEADFFLWQITERYDDLLELGLPLEGHADNLAAAIRGGVCLIWQNGAGPHTARIAADLPLAPIVVLPHQRVNTLESRGRLPETLTHEDAAAASAQSALLGAAIASGDAKLLAAAFHDRLHEPFRLEDAPMLAELRNSPVAGQAGVTLSGSGPSVVVWVDKGSDPLTVVTELRQRFPDAQVLPLKIADQGAH